MSDLSESEPRIDVQLTDEQQAFDDRVFSLFGRLGESGWISAGGWDTSKFTANIGSTFDPEIKILKADDVLSRLPIKDSDDQLLPGFEVGDDPDTGTVYIGYEGPITETVERVINAMTEVGFSNMESLTEFDNEIGRLAVSPDAGYFDRAVGIHRGEGVGDVNDGETVVLTARRLVREDLFEWRNAVFDAEEAGKIPSKEFLGKIGRAAKKLVILGGVVGAGLWLVADSHKDFFGDNPKARSDSEMLDEAWAIKGADFVTRSAEYQFIQDFVTGTAYSVYTHEGGNGFAGWFDRQRDLSLLEEQKTIPFGSNCLEGTAYDPTVGRDQRLRPDIDNLIDDEDIIYVRPANPSLQTLLLKGSTADNLTPLEKTDVKILQDYGCNLDLYEADTARDDGSPRVYEPQTFLPERTIV